VETVDKPTKDNCIVCKEPIMENRDVAELGYFDAKDQEQHCKCHPECFVCHQDKKPILDSYAIVDDCIYCPDHHTEVFCPRCQGCTKYIEAGCSLVRALHQTYHTQCFVCVKCSNTLGGQVGSSFGFHAHAGDLYCKPCSVDLKSKCSACGFPLGGERCVDADGSSYHAECFTCTDCGIHLADAGKEYGKRPGIKNYFYCPEHYKTHLSEWSDSFSTADVSIKTAVSFTKPSTPSFSSSSGAKKREKKVTENADITGDQYGACLSLGIANALTKQAAVLRASPGDKALRKESYKTRDNSPLESSPDDGGIEFDFEAFAPAVFQDLRNNAFSISEEDYRHSISHQPCTGGATGAGKSGSLFFFTFDKRLIVKTIGTTESAFFTNCLQDYHAHLLDKSVQRRSNGTVASMLSRILGFYSIKIAEQKVIRVIVMENVFPEGKMREVYDLKGVVGKQRFVSDKQKAEGTSVLLDRNVLEKKLKIEEKVVSHIVEMLKRDAEFLHKRDRVDYSLLLGVQALEDAKEKPRGAGWPFPETNGVRSVVDGKTEVLYMGVIDFLQPYTNKKLAEVMFKRARHRVEGLKKEKDVSLEMAITIAPPVDYAKRYIEFLEPLLRGSGMRFLKTAASSSEELSSIK